MYLEGIITIDPSQITQIKKIKPTKAFKKFLYHLTLGNISNKEEQETFTAVAILQQLNATFRSLHINNIIKISHDDIDFYHDKDGLENDLKQALDEYEIQVDESMSVHFQKLTMVLEHIDNDFKYLIEICINKNHSVGDYPIEIKITGLFTEFNTTKVDTGISEITKDQATFDSFKNSKINTFEYFINQFKLELKKHMAIDDVKSHLKTKIVLPKEKITSRQQLRSNPNSEGIHFGYHGFGDALFYSFIWSDIMHEQNIMVTDSYFETETGDALGFSNEINSSDTLFDSTTDTNLDSINAVSEDSILENDIDTDDASSNWFQIDSSGDSDSTWSSCSSDSSCSSCSSCGGD